MKRENILLAVVFVVFTNTLSAQEENRQIEMKPEMSESYTYQPPQITPGTVTSNAFLTAPSDAVVLFDGKDLSKWETMDGKTARWNVHDGVLTVDKSAGDIRTKDCFNDFQLHIEWMIPEDISGEGQWRGNSGVSLQGMYEIQILDNYDNKTYSNGQAGSVYKQYPPLVNPIRKPGEWNEYDIIYTAPTFKKDGTYRTRPVCTVLFNGVVVQNSIMIWGTTEYIGFPKTVEHGDGPIILQAHGDPSQPISFRNIWIRRL